MRFRDMVAIKNATDILEKYADTPEELDRFIEIATELGTIWVEQDTATIMESFALVFARKSFPRLDMFGISANMVRGRGEELLSRANEGMSHDEAFKIAVLEAADIAIERMGGKTLGEYARLQVAIANLIVNSWMWFAATKVCDFLARWI